MRLVPGFFVATIVAVFLAGCGSNGSSASLVDAGHGPDASIESGSGVQLDSGPDGNPSSTCTPLTCADQHISCGAAGDGCGNVIQCGSCKAPQTCGGGGTPSQCGGTQGCVPKTCQQLGIQCGPAGDGCGGLLQCGSCTAPETCGGGGTPFKCGSGSTDGGTPNCTPKTCAQLGKTCGPVADGCGGLLQCGTCKSPDTCGGGGVPSVCGTPNSTADAGKFCTPKTCAQLGISCGPAGDGCGGLLQCGTCTAPATCGGAGTPSQCGSPTCVAKTCAQLGITCGPAGDGCGGLLQCGTCTAPDTCGGGGKPGVCGKPSCTPKTCAQLGASCGYVADGCGNVINCGTCASPLFCGGGGPNVCGNGSNSGSGCDGGGTTSLSGYVFDPGNHLPVYNALVYVPVGAVQTPQTGVSPAQCGCTAPHAYASAYTGIDGKFTMTGVPSGANVTVVVQLGKWQRVFTESVSACTANNLGGGTAGSAANLTLPSTHLEGHIPLFAVDTGAVDAMECVLLKMGIAQSEFTDPDIVNGKPTAAGRIQFYQGSIERGGAIIDNNTPTEDQLTEHASVMNSYDVILFPCQGRAGRYTAANGWPNTLSNLANYADSGGRAFATHFHYDLIEGNTNGNFTNTANWAGDVNYLNNATGIIDQSFARGTALAKWLNQPIVYGGTLGQIPVQMVRQDFYSVNAPAQRWMYLNSNYPIHYTFDTPFNQSPTCGRVVYSDFHVENAYTHNMVFPSECTTGGLTPQEKLLEFMLFDLTSCVSPPTCAPLTCSQQGIQCGQAGNGCGGQISCGTCPSGSTCQGTPAQCVPMCTPKTCAQQNITCGPAGDGCGGTLNCGTCKSPQICGGGGVPGQCGAPTCVPTTCAQLGYSCGPAGDGCGGLLDCGTCPSGQICGGGGTPGVCGAPDGGFCQPQTCAQQGLSCGPAGDGCGNVIQCGSCPAGQSCGGGGVPGQCGAPACTPLTCAQQGLQCGPAGDGCGGTLDCGTCTPPQTCGGGGQPGVCGQPNCTPTTCAAQKANCGVIANGCGGTLDCGTCTAPQTCGGNGVANQCGSPPAPA